MPKGYPLPDNIGSIGPGPEVPKENQAPITLRPTSDNIMPSTPSQREIINEPVQPRQGNEQQVPSNNQESISRRTARIRKPVDRFKFNKAHGYLSIKKFT